MRKRNQTFLRVLPASRQRQHCVVPTKRPARFTNGLEAPDRSRPHVPPAAVIFSRRAPVFIPRCGESVVPPCGNHKKIQEFVAEFTPLTRHLHWQLKIVW